MWGSIHWCSSVRHMPDKLNSAHRTIFTGLNVFQLVIIAQSVGGKKQKNTRRECSDKDFNIDVTT